jgi:transcription regulator MmyB-like protein
MAQRVRPVVQRIADAMTAPAIVRNSRVDYLSANALGRALYAPVFESREQPANSARFTFLDPAAQDFYADWERTAKDLVAHQRSEAGRNPYRPARRPAPSPHQPDRENHADDDARDDPFVDAPQRRHDARPRPGGPVSCLNPA